MRIVIDAMGGDNAPEAIIAACAEFIKDTDAEIILCGKKNIIEEMLAKYAIDKSRVEIADCDDVISDHDEPVKAVKQKKNASMVVAARLLSEGRADAMLSLGNTGALLSAGLLIVGREKGILRPVLATVLPTAKGGKLLIDAGANTNCRSAALVQFAVMGELYMKKVFGIKEPKIGLINNGAEAEKGTVLTKETNALLAQTDLNFIGNIEGRDIMEGVADVMVCDGFTGNVILKTIEGMGSVISRNLKEMFKRNLTSMIGALCVKKGLGEFKKSMDYREYGGAPILGLKKLVVKGHGSSDEKAVYSTLMQIETTSLADITKDIAAAVLQCEEKQE